jgi:uncharacterized membrane protein YdjX (TVP38/TMEM64 family)
MAAALNQSDTVSASQGLTAAVNRYARLIKWASILFVVLSLVLLFRLLPVGPALETLEGWIKDLGFWGPIVFGLIYAAAVVLVVPASTLTLIAGGIFGFWIALVMVSLSSTTGAALAFLISRYLARDRIVRMMTDSPRLHAIDQAINEGGWKIVALLRLSPAIPFNLQNYLYGVTGIPFWTCVLTSWVAMLPGTFLYVYLGYAAKVSVEVSAGQQGKSPGEWAFLAVGLVATVVVTVYVTYLARKALRRQAGLASIAESNQGKASGQAPAITWPWGTTILAAIALLLLAGAIYLQFHPDFLEMQP